ncbi:MAG TPA: NmrA family NAD(P)-binding protein [Ornithinibacter sp.]|nr:NmrA family NAD(P)-binding protein [Ornithinibacter sp.]
MSAPVLVVGASGKTGRAVSRALVARGVPVRAAVRAGREDAAPPGTDPVAVDLETGLGLEAALTGVRAVYHLAPNVHPDEVGMAARLADAAASAGLSRLVFHSVLHPDDTRMPHHVRKGEAEVLLRQALGGRVVVLRPAAYHQNLLGQARAGVMTVPYSPDAPFTTVDLGDVAAVAASALLGSGARGGVHDLAGPEPLTTREMAEQASVALGRPVRVERITLDAWLDGPGATLTDQARHDLAAMFTAYDEGGLVGDPATLTALLQHAPTTWAQAVSRSLRARPAAGDGTMRG